MKSKRGDLVKVIYDHHYFSYGIYLSDMNVIIHDGDIDTITTTVDSIVDTYFNIPDKTDKEYSEILLGFIKKYEPIH